MTEHLRIPDDEHIPVLEKEVLDFLQCRPEGIYVDATVGLGGHSQSILEKIKPGGLRIGIDRDKESLEKANSRLRQFADNVRLFHDNYKNLPLILNNMANKPVDGILVDLGVSSYQLLSQERGFSFQSDAILDMRMDRRERVVAATAHVGAKHDTNDKIHRTHHDETTRYGHVCSPVRRALSAPCDKR